MKKFNIISLSIIGSCLLSNTSFAIRKIVSTPYVYPSHTIVFMGDSLMHNDQTGVLPDEMMVGQMEKKLIANGYHCKGVNEGIAGNTSWDMWNRILKVWTLPWGVPDMGVIESGVNDPANVATITSLSSSSTTATAVMTTPPADARIIAGQQVTVNGATPSGYNGTVTVLSTSTATTISAISTTTVTLNSVSYFTASATVGSTAIVGIVPGMSVTVSGVTPSGYNGTVTVLGVGSTSFNYYVSSALGSGSGTMVATYNANGLCDNTFTYAVTSGLTTPATGTITVNPMPQSVTQNNVQAMIQAERNKVDGIAEAPSLLPANVFPGALYEVRTDNDSTGGSASIPVAYPSQPATWTGSGGNVAHLWICSSSGYGTAGWRRIHPPNLGIKNIVVITPPFLNYASGQGGDVANTITNPGDVSAGESASYASVRAAVFAAATAESVGFFDWYKYFNDLIMSGVQTQYSNCWSYIPNNVHLSLLGHINWTDGLYAYLIAHQATFMNTLTQ